MVSTLLYGCESWKLTKKECKKLNSAGSKMLAKIAWRETAEEARMPTVDVILQYVHKIFDGSGLGTMFRMDERGLVRLVLLKCVKPTPESIFGDLIDTDVQAAISLAKARIKWNKNRPSKR